MKLVPKKLNMGTVGSVWLEFLTDNWMIEAHKARAEAAGFRELTDYAFHDGASKVLLVRVNASSFEDVSKWGLSTEAVEVMKVAREVIDGTREAIPVPTRMLRDLEQALRDTTDSDPVAAITRALPDHEPQPVVRKLVELYAHRVMDVFARYQRRTGGQAPKFSERGLVAFVREHWARGDAGIFKAADRHFKKRTAKMRKPNDSVGTEARTPKHGPKTTASLQMLRRACRL